MELIKCNDAMWGGIGSVCSNQEPPSITSRRRRRRETDSEKERENVTERGGRNSEEGIESNCR